ncbi:MAG: FIST C-terminal domain-containing protein [Treponema sp.]|nr:FIST C-terminal domain-containing protein [Treponema sp.]
MIQMMTAFTTEVDEVDDALVGLLEQIDITALRKNSVGIITCHFDFTTTSIFARLREKLPFDIIGMTTLASANRHGSSMYALSLTVLTSDDVFFQTEVTAPLDIKNHHGEIAAAYNRACGKLPGPPAMALGFFPYVNTLSGAMMVSSFDSACGGIPVWGSLATNIDVSFEKCHAFRNSEQGLNVLAMLVIHGPIDPEFFVVAIPRQKIRENRGMITKSSGCVLQEINGIPALQYFESTGVVIMKDSPIVTPLMVYYEGAADPVALGIYTVCDDGSLICGGEMPQGAMIAAGEISHDGIISTAEECVNRVLGSGKKDGVLMLPCVTRYVMLSPDPNSEMDRVAELMNGSTPYMLGYSGGEVCPVRDESGKWQNRFHNYTFSACAF